jgi:hypothetical protein
LTLFKLEQENILDWNWRQVRFELGQERQSLSLMRRLLSWKKYWYAIEHGGEYFNWGFKVIWDDFVIQLDFMNELEDFQLLFDLFMEVDDHCVLLHPPIIYSKEIQFEEMKFGFLVLETF